MTDKVKIGVVGVGIAGIGNMGGSHLKDLAQIKNAKLVAICDHDIERADQSGKEHKAKIYYNYEEFLKDSEIEAIIIATPHYSHTPIAIEAFKRGIHVLCEKPVGVHVNDIIKMNNAYMEAKKTKKDLLFSAMFQQRTYGHWLKIKEMLDYNMLGKLIRTTWIITNWFRTQYYYDGGGWRATWKGEGGGVLLNQCPHNIDLYQWFVGMPDKITGFMGLGKYHNIEVEDEVTAYFEYKNGMVGHFITTTAESPGTNFLEIVGENGRLVYDDLNLTFFKNNESSFYALKNSKEAFYKPDFEKNKVKYEHHGEPGHRFIIENFINAISKGEKLLVEGKEGLNSVMISNAIMLSAFDKKTIELPINGDEFENKLNELIKNSNFKKNIKTNVKVDNLSKSF